MKKISVQTAKKNHSTPSDRVDPIIGKRTRSIVLINNFENSKSEDEDWASLQEA